MNAWVRICAGVVLLGFGAANIAFAIATDNPMPSATRFKVIFYLVLFVLPGVIELKAAAYVALLAVIKRRLSL